jgi:membrane-bound ClpP family serine protease
MWKCPVLALAQCVIRSRPAISAGALIALAADKIVIAQAALSVPLRPVQMGQPGAQAATAHRRGDGISSAKRWDA